MKKKIIFFALCSLMVLQGAGRCVPPVSRGLFVSLIQNPPVLTSREAMTGLVAFAKRSRIKILFVQVYRAGQAWFPSEVGDTRAYEAAVMTLGEDPFAFLIKEAHGSGIEVHAWLNMLSLSENEEAPLLKKYGPEILTRNLDEKKTLSDYKIDSQYFLEPGDPRVRQELVKITGEIVRVYPALDGIQFDYIRYPDSHPRYGYTRINMERFKQATGARAIKEGSVDWDQWKRDQVTGLLKLLVKEARSNDPDIRISATGCMSYARALHEAFQDWPLWVNAGLVDFVTVMNYSEDQAQYERWNAVALSKVSDPEKLYMGVPAYKLVRSPDVFEKEWKSCEGSGAALCAAFHYGGFLENKDLGNPLFGKG